MQEIKSRKYQCIKSRRFQNRRVKIKEHSSDTAMFWWDAKERRKGGNGKQKKRNILERLNSPGLQINLLIRFLKAAVIKMRAMLFSTLLKVRQN